VIMVLKFVPPSKGKKKINPKTTQGWL